MDNTAEEFVAKYDELENAFATWRSNHPNAGAADFAAKHYELVDQPLWEFRRDTEGGDPPGQPPPPPPQ